MKKFIVSQLLVAITGVPFVVSNLGPLGNTFLNGSIPPAFAEQATSQYDYAFFGQGLNTSNVSVFSDNPQSFQHAVSDNNNFVTNNGTSTAENSYDQAFSGQNYYVNLMDQHTFYGENTPGVNKQIQNTYANSFLGSGFHVNETIQSNIYNA